MRWHIVTSPVTPAKKLSAILEGLGTTFVKLGQGLSLRQDILPDDYIEALQSLQDQVRTFPGEMASAEIERALGKPVGSLFAEFDIHPMAAASIAQVHKARLHDGREVIVKVRRPGLRQQVLLDIQLLKLVLRGLLLLIPRLQQYALLEIVRESGLNLMKEMDFRLEVSNILHFEEAFRGSDTVHIPAAIPEFSSKSVLVQEFAAGRLVTDPAIRNKHARLAADFCDAYLYQLFVMGCIHADPHPGNLFIMDDGKICFHDFGLVAHVDLSTRHKLAGFFLALNYQDSEWLLDAYLDLGFLGDEVDRQQVQRGLNELMQEYAATPPKERSFATAMLGAVRMGWGFNLRLPYHLLIILRAMFLMESTLRSLDPEFNLITYWRDKGVNLLTSALKKQPGESTSARLKYEAMVIAQELPIALSRWLHSAPRKGFEIPLHHYGLQDFERHIDRSSNRIALALVALGLYIASSLLAQSGLQPLIAGIPLIAVGGYLLALWVTFRLLMGISRSGRL